MTSPSLALNKILSLKSGYFSRKGLNVFFSGASLNIENLKIFGVHTVFSLVYCGEKKRKKKGKLTTSVFFSLLFLMQLKWQSSMR